MNASDQNLSRIESTSDVCNGEPRILGTRVPVSILGQYRKLGVSDAKLLDYYPFLSPDDLAAAWRFLGEQEGASSSH